jgi:polyisoprenoid-binding protein YceI
MSGTNIATISPGLEALTRGTWNVDPAHSSVGFVARHLMISKVRGTFRTFSGAITVASDPLESRVEATVDLASVSTGDDGRDAHLRGPDFFDVEQHPTMTFVSTAVRRERDGFVLVGDLTIKGVTRPVEFDLEFDGVSADPWGNLKAGFSASTEINRKDWDLGWNVALEAGGVLVGEKVKIVLDVQAVRTAD